MTEYFFTTKKLCVGYQGKPVVHDLNISLKKGEILTLIGPNGAGKSTILKSITGQLALIAGTVCVEQKPLAELPEEEVAKKLSVVLTDRIRTELMTCEDVVATGRYPYTGRFGMLSKEDHRIVTEAMELVHVLELREQDFTQISDGQRQRVMLARAIAQEPEIIILDEPTSYLDVKYKLEFLSVLQQMREKKGLTVIMSLHELELAERISDKILCVKGEYVQKIGVPKEIFKPGYIRELFEITEGSFDEENGTMELAPAAGAADVFVLAGNGMGREVYRSLQRQGRAFVTGIIYENDLDYPVARALATQVIAAEAFEPVAEDVFDKAKAWMDACAEVICCREQFGSMEQANRRLLTYAKEKGKVIWQK